MQTCFLLNLKIKKKEPFLLKEILPIKRDTYKAPDFLVMSWWKELLKYSSCVSVSVWVEEMKGSRGKTRKDGFIENFYDLISGVSDLIV